jgi:hypothetical protein
MRANCNRKRILRKAGDLLVLLTLLTSLTAAVPVYSEYCRSGSCTNIENNTFLPITDNHLEEPVVTQAYDNYSQFVDPVYPEKTISGSGQGEILFTFVIIEAIPVFSGRYSQDIVGINIPPISTPFEVNGSRNGYVYLMGGLYMSDEPNNFTVKADGVKDLNIGLRKDPKVDGNNATRTWVTEQIVAQDGIAKTTSDQISPGSYHVKIFGDAIDNSSKVLLTLTLDKKVIVDGKFNLSVNTTGFPSGDYSMTAKSLNGSFYLDEIELGGISIVS